MCKLKAKWLKEYQDWCKEDLRAKRYVYWWADGVHSNVRMDDTVLWTNQPRTQAYIGVIWIIHKSLLM